MLSDLARASIFLVVFQSRGCNVNTIVSFVNQWFMSKTENLLWFVCVCVYVTARLVFLQLKKTCLILWDTNLTVYPFLNQRIKNAMTCYQCCIGPAHPVGADPFGGPEYNLKTTAANYYPYLVEQTQLCYSWIQVVGVLAMCNFENPLKWFFL